MRFSPPLHFTKNIASCLNLKLRQAKKDAKSAKAFHRSLFSQTLGSSELRHWISQEEPSISFSRAVLLRNLVLDGSVSRNSRKSDEPFVFRSLCLEHPREYASRYQPPKWTQSIAYHKVPRRARLRYHSMRLVLELPHVSVLSRLSGCGSWILNSLRVGHSLI